MTQSELFQRYADVILALSTSERYGENLGRLQLQKFIYLCDILSLAWNILSSDDGHETYKHGPYDYKIQNAVDALSFRGFVKIEFLKLDKKNMSTTSNYSLTDPGKLLYERLLSAKLYKTKDTIYKLIAKNVNRRGWTNLKSIVYSEVSYVNKVGFYNQIDTNSYTNNATIQLVDLFNNLSKRKPIKPEDLVTIFFKITDNYRKLNSQSYA